MIQKNTPRPPMKGQVGQPAAHVTADPCLKEKNRIAWGEMIRQARQGSPAALEQCIAYATPFVEGYCNSRFFASQLGKDEIRSIGLLALTEFFKSSIALPKDPEVPFLLIRILRNTILNRIYRQKACTRLEQPTTLLDLAAFNEEKQGFMETLWADRNQEPEHKLLQKEQAREVHQALKKLGEPEQTILHGLFFLEKSTKEIAAELKCSTSAVWKGKGRGLKRLRELLDDCQIFRNGALGC